MSDSQRVGVIKNVKLPAAVDAIKSFLDNNQLLIEELETGNFTSPEAKQALEEWSNGVTNKNYDSSSLFKLIKPFCLRNKPVYAELYALGSAAENEGRRNIQHDFMGLTAPIINALSMEIINFFGHRLMFNYEEWDPENYADEILTDADKV